MTRTDQIQAIHAAFTSKDFVRLAVLQRTVPAEVFEEAGYLALATLQLEDESEMRKVNGLVFLTQHAAGMTVAEGIRSLDSDELLEFSRIVLGDDE